ncbi:MAG: class I SAM-dependent methyltransferase, partial [Phycisphaerae bacterium]|nr:class I SAM-dependent methyltransferase [Phycisphaerae bacterium]
VKQKIREFADFLPTISREEPIAFLEAFDSALDTIDTLSRHCPDSRSELKRMCIETCAAELDRSVMHWRSTHKPLGYAGDYQIIESIYDCKSDSPGRGRLWDNFYNDHAACQAVRNRKDFFCQVFASVCERTTAPRSVLDIACGPCREVTDAVSQAGELARGTHFHCIDIESKAIDYAQDRLGALEGVTFQWDVANALRMQPDHQYDLVWSAGLFDYLNDRLAILLLKRMWRWTKAGGDLCGREFPSAQSQP